MEKAKREQYVLSQVGRVLVGKYLSPKGQSAMADADYDKASGMITLKEYKKRKAVIEAKYQKNRYCVNPKAVVVKKIVHLRGLGNQTHME